MLIILPHVAFRRLLMTLSKEQSGKEQSGAAVLKCSFMRPIGICKGDTFQADDELCGSVSYYFA